MAGSLCFDLDGLTAGVTNLLGIGISFDIALDHTDRDLIVQVLDRAGDRCRLSRAWGRDDIEAHYIVLFEKCFILFGTLFIAAQNFLVQLDLHSFSSNSIVSSSSGASGSNSNSVLSHWLQAGL